MMFWITSRLVFNAAGYASQPRNEEPSDHDPSDMRCCGIGAVDSRSPVVQKSFEALYPKHGTDERQVCRSFKVQLRDEPSPPHSQLKDGNYFIHPDATQMRSLTVREAGASDISDNYFEGSQGWQHGQVGVLFRSDGPADCRVVHFTCAVEQGFRPFVPTVWLQASQRCFGVGLECTFPDCPDTPSACRSAATARSRVRLAASFSAQNSTGCRLVPATCMGVPEASVDDDCGTVLGQHEIGLSRQVLRRQAIAKAQLVKVSANDQLRLRITERIEAIIRDRTGIPSQPLNDPGRCRWMVARFDFRSGFEEIDDSRVRGAGAVGCILLACCCCEYVDSPED